jgi:uncharacterized protein YjbJ (UPF0337 family)
MDMRCIDDARRGGICAPGAGTPRVVLGPLSATLNGKEPNMKSGIRDQAEGAMKEVKGQAKQKWAKTTGDPAKHVEGAKDRALGKIQQKTGQIKRDTMRE